MSQFAKGTGLDRRLIHRTLKKLSSKQMIVIYRDDKFRIRYGFQKNYSKWNDGKMKKSVIHRDDKKAISDGNTEEKGVGKSVIHRDDSVIYRDDQVSSIEMTTKDNIQKTSKDLSFQTPKNGRCPYKEIVDLYHKILPELPAVLKLTDTRKKQIKARWENDLKKDLNEYERYFNFVRQYPFLMGKKRGASFKASLEWLTKESNFTKVIENFYE